MKIKKYNGFTLIETLVALVLITIAITPTIFAAATTNRVANSIKNNLIAANLTQEGIEVIRAIRDTNWFQGTAFDNGLVPGEYEVEWDSDLPLVIYQDRFLTYGSLGRYRYGAINPTPFKRKITISKPDTYIIKVTSLVTWGEGTQTRSVSVDSYLYDWK
ncbi:MAG: type II secretion system protein [Candidatus Yanofskybacteria bacterium]|nr:type II secretion system protein [Candidatus Yanofskybacteria bacterium]